ncbi:MAG: AAA family ATPase, partial [Bryobacteraceae bacterium]
MNHEDGGLKMEDGSTSPRPSPQRGERELFGATPKRAGETPALPFTDSEYEALCAHVLTPENRVRAAALGGENCFLTGAGGTGKTTQLRAFIADVANTKRRVNITAPTGVAALNVGGMTIHRFCGMLIGPAVGQSNEDYFAQLQRDPRRSILAGFNR